MTDLEALRHALRTCELPASGWIDLPTVIAEGRRLRSHRRAALTAAMLLLAAAVWLLWERAVT